VACWLMGRDGHVWRALIGSGWRDCTTLNFLSTYGVTSFVRSVWWWNQCTVPMISTLPSPHSIPGPERRLGVLLDHLVDGSKESRIAAGIRRTHVLVTGHPFVDVWAGVRPRVVGLQAWPDVPRGVPFKQGLCDAVGMPLEGFWPRLRSAVDSFADLEPELVGAVERLIDFVAPPG